MILLFDELNLFIPWVFSNINSSWLCFCFKEKIVWYDPAWIWDTKPIYGHNNRWGTFTPPHTSFFFEIPNCPTLLDPITYKLLFSDKKIECSSPLQISIIDSWNGICFTLNEIPWMQKTTHVFFCFFSNSTLYQSINKLTTTTITNSMPTSSK